MLGGTPDRGWAWVVAAAGFGAQFLQGMFGNGLGILNMALLDTYKEDAAKTSLVGSLYGSVSAFIGPFGSILINSFSCRTTHLIGATLLFIGSLLSAFVNEIDYIIITFGLMAGAGQGLTYTPTVVSVGYYFDRYLGLAFGVVILGAGCGTIACGAIIQSLVDRYSVSGAFLMMAGIGAHHFIIGMLYRPSTTEILTKTQRLKEREMGPSPILAYFKSILNFDVLRNRPFVFFMLSTFCWNFSIGIILMYLPKYTTVKGLTKSDSSFLWMLFGIGSTISRFLTGLSIGEHGLDPLLLYLGQEGICGMLTVTFPLYSDSLTGHMCYFFIFGIYSGGLNTLTNPLTVKLVGVKHLPSATGILCFMMGVAFAISPPIAGLMLDNGISYETCIIISGGALILSALICMLAAIGRSDLTEKLVHPIAHVPSIILSVRSSTQSVNQVAHSLENIPLRVIDKCELSDSDCDETSEIVSLKKT